MSFALFGLAQRVPAALWSGLFFAAAFVAFPSTGRDDVHITYWAAHALATTGHIVNYSGLAMEQSSSLLHVLLLATLTRLTGLSLPDLGTPLSLLFGVLAAREAGRLARIYDPHAARWAMWLAASAIPLLYWSYGALETTLVAFVLTAFARALAEALHEPIETAAWRPLAWGLLYLLARPESWFVLTALLLGTALLAPRRFVLRRTLGLWAALSAAFVALVAWRLQTFGQALPQPVYAKISGHLLDQLGHGFDYLGRVARQCPGLVALLIGAAAGALPAWRDAPLRRALAPVLALIAAQGAFLLCSGGDWMEGARFFVPLVPAAAALAALALVRLPPARMAVVGVAALAVSAPLGAWATRDWSTSVPLYQLARYDAWSREQGLDADRFSFFERANRVHLRDALFIPRLEAVVDQRLRLQDPVTLMSAQGGMVAFHLLQSRAGHVRFLDMAGLTSREFAECAVTRRGEALRVAGGIGMSHAFYLQHRDEFRDECGIPRPDIVFDLDDAGFPTAGRFAAAGYATRVRQDLPLCPPGLRCSRSVKPFCFAAERAESSPP